jgi:exodeoxyribonuclease V alpha subunit
MDESKRLHASTTIVGTMPSIQEGETLQVTGDWEIHPVHGRNFRVESFEQHMPDTDEAVERYLASGAIQGIGPVTARRIVEAFGTATMEILDTNPQMLRQVPGITAKRLEQVVSSWSEQKQVRDLSLFLQSHGISMALAPRMYAKYGENAVTIVQTDPYQLARDIQGIGFRTADSVAEKLGISKQSPSRRVAGLLHTLSQAADSGHIFLPRSELLEEASKLLEVRIPDLDAALLDLFQTGEAVLEEDHVYLAAFHTAESGVANSLLELQSAPSSVGFDNRFDSKTAISAAAEHQGLVLAEKQLAAAEQALRQKVSILTGGPGTGKTSTLRTIIDALESSDVSFCLCAPTGRAAKRVSEATGRPASTIHRLLEFQPATSRFGFDRSRPLAYDFVIVDEVSMLDLLLCYHLLKAVPAESHLLLVGDADQLPSVGPGNVLRDLLTSGSIPTVTLTELFRQAAGSQIVLAAHAVNRGQMPDLSSREDTDFYFVRSEAETSVLDLIKRLVVERIPERYGRDPVEDVQVLSPMHAGPAGVVSLNQELQAALNPSKPGITELQRGERLFRVGDKVMQTKNNYDKDVYNGDIGRIVGVSSDPASLTVAFPAPGGALEVEYEATDLDELVLAYAVSVHKAQGSEFPCVLVPIVPRHTMLLQRSLVYTAITRARELCVLVGSEATFRRAVQRQERQQRHSGLRQRLSSSVAPAQAELV